MQTLATRPAFAARGAAEAPSPWWRERAVWRDAAVAWLGPRVLFMVLTVACRGLVSTFATRGHPSGWHWLTFIWGNWDAAHYATIATSGYTQPAQSAFYPLFPLLIRLATPLTLGDPLLAGIVLANLCAFGALVFFRALAERELGPRRARRALLYFALFPVGIFLAAGYSESLFLLLSLAAFLALGQGKWLAAGGLAALATLTRPVGVLLVIPLAWAAFEALRAGGGIERARLTAARMAGAVALPLLALGGFAVYLAGRFGRIMAAAEAEGTGEWRRALSWPWDGPLRAASAVWRDTPGHALHAALDLAFTALFVALAVGARRGVPRVYALYCWVTLGIVLLLPMHGYDWAALASNSRFLLATFPLFFVLARWGERRWVHLAIVGVSALLLVLYTLTWIAGGFVA